LGCYIKNHVVFSLIFKNAETHDRVNMTNHEVHRADRAVMQWADSVIGIFGELMPCPNISVVLQAIAKLAKALQLGTILIKVSMELNKEIADVLAAMKKETKDVCRAGGATLAAAAQRAWGSEFNKQKKEFASGTAAKKMFQTTATELKAHDATITRLTNTGKTIMADIEEQEDAAQEQKAVAASGKLEVKRIYAQRLVVELPPKLHAIEDFIMFETNCTESNQRRKSNLLQFQATIKAAMTRWTECVGELAAILLAAAKLNYEKTVNARDAEVRKAAEKRRTESDDDDVAGTPHQGKAKKQRVPAAATVPMKCMSPLCKTLIPADPKWPGWWGCQKCGSKTYESAYMWFCPAPQCQAMLKSHENSC
jgi:hypothetical protein